MLSVELEILVLILVDVFISPENNIYFFAFDRTM